MKPLKQSTWNRIAPAPSGDYAWPKTALITGITGQDGAYLAELLLGKGYEVHGIKRRSSSFNTGRIDHLYQDPHERDVRLIAALWRHDRRDQPHPHRAGNAAGRDLQSRRAKPCAGELRDRRIHRQCRCARHAAPARGDPPARPDEKTRFYQASTSELYGKVQEIPQSRNDALLSRARPMRAAKLYAYWITVNYREAYGMHASNGILFNHESPIRGETFVTRKITRAVAAISSACRTGSISAISMPSATGAMRATMSKACGACCSKSGPTIMCWRPASAHSVRDFVETAFAEVGQRRSNGAAKASAEKGIDARAARVLVEIDPRYFRPTEVDLLLGDASKARRVLGWSATTHLRAMVGEMVQSGPRACAPRRGAAGGQRLSTPGKPVRGEDFGRHRLLQFSPHASAGPLPRSFRRTIWTPD